MSLRCYAEAARRHYDDAQYLEAAAPPRSQNADHLYGLSADSAAAAIELAVNTRGGARYADATRVHINRNWNELLTWHGSLARVASGLATLDKKNPFQDWDVNQRYHCNKTAEAAALDRHKKAAARLLSILEQLRTAGVLT